MSSSHSLEEVGIIVGEASSTEFVFVSERENYPPKWEYLVIRSNEFIDGELRPVDVVAQVEKVASVSDVMTQQLDLEALERIRRAKLDEIRTLGHARIIGYVQKEIAPSEKKAGEVRTRVLLPRRAVAPGEHVYIAPREVLRNLFSYSEDEGLHVGNLISRPDIPVYLSVSGFRRHVAIIAQTGAGKSYCAGVLIEELLDRGASVIVVDPHADYVLLSLSQSGGRFEHADRVAVFRNPASTGRYNDKEVGNVMPYEIAFQDLNYDQVCEVAGIAESYTNIREAVRVCVDTLNQEGKHYLPQHLREKLEKLGTKPRKTVNKEMKPSEENEDQIAEEQIQDEQKIRIGASSAVKYVRRLVDLKVFGLQSTPITDLLEPMRASVIDLSGLEDRSMDYIVYRILSETFNHVADGTFHFPVFIIIEEAHKFVPPKEQGETFSSYYINKIAAEGRKFGVFLILVTQRPSKVDQDSLSQCNSQIVMKLTNPCDQNAVGNSSERMSRDLLEDLPGLNPGEAVIVGDITKAPVMVRIRTRKTMEGGADIDVVNKLKLAKQEAGADRMSEANRRRQMTLKKGQFSEV
nr:ATP-binding protein [Candidatus Njordarchaeota archaeon]